MERTGQRYAGLFISAGENRAVCECNPGVCPYNESASIQNILAVFFIDVRHAIGHRALRHYARRCVPYACVLDSCAAFPCADCSLARIREILQSKRAGYMHCICGNTVTNSLHARGVRANKEAGKQRQKAGEQ